MGTRYDVIKGSVISTEGPQGRSGETRFSTQTSNRPKNPQPTRPYHLRPNHTLTHHRTQTGSSNLLGPQAALDIVDTLLNEPSLKNYHLLPNVRGDLLTKLNRHHEARTEFQRVATLTCNTQERNLLLKRAKDCA